MARAVGLGPLLRDLQKRGLSLRAVRQQSSPNAARPSRACSFGNRLVWVDGTG